MPWRAPWRSLFTCTLFLLAPFRADASVSFLFVDVSAGAGLTDFTPPGGMGAGAAAADFDEDGDIDVFVPTEIGTPNRLYQNSGGSFTDIAAAAGVASTDRARAALWFDYDGDGVLDLLVAGDCFDVTTFPAPPSVTCPGPGLKLYRQVSPAVFQDVSVASGLALTATSAANSHIGGLAAGDVDNNGYLDVIVAVWGNERWLFLNDGDGTFTDVTDLSGVGLVDDRDWQPMLHDFDGDGWLDISQAIDFTENRLWQNQRNDRFVDTAPAAGLDTAFNEMGNTMSDADNDGDLDIYFTNIKQAVAHNVLYENETVGGVLDFTDIGPAAGVDDTGWGWGTTFFDANLDGWVDLAATNGFAGVNDPSRFFVNDGTLPLSFTDVSGTVDFDDTFWGAALLAFDYDRDGDQDLLQIANVAGKARLLENQRSGAVAANHYLVVKPRSNGTNHFGIGALVRVTAGGTQMTRLISAGTSFMGQEPAEAFFGLGSQTLATEVRVEWPDGSTSVLTNVAADQIVVVTPDIEIAVSEPSESLTESGPVSWTVHYTGADTVTLSDTDVSVQASGTAAASSVVVTGSGSSQRTVTLSGISGVGGLALEIAAGTATGPGTVASSFGPGTSVQVSDQGDDDGDGVPNPIDNCPQDANPLQQDTDGNGLGDACNAFEDTDSDEWANALDNCPAVFNPDQTDLDENGVGDLCEYSVPATPVGGIVALGGLLLGTGLATLRRRRAA